MLLHDVFHNPNVVCMLMIILAQKLVAYENHRTMQQLRDSMVLELRSLYLAAFVLMELDYTRFHVSTLLLQRVGWLEDAKTDMIVSAHWILDV